MVSGGCNVTKNRTHKKIACKILEHDGHMTVMVLAKKYDHSLVKTDHNLVLSQN